MEETPLEAIPAFNTPAPKRPVNKRFVYLVLTILVLFIALFSYKVFGTSNKKAITQSPAVITSTPTIFTEEQSQSLTPTATPTEVPTPTVNPIDKATGLDRSKLSVTVQNGSGEAGVAGKASDTLKGLGYDVVGTGNADNFDYANVVIQVKSGNSDYLDLLKTDLGLSYTIGSTSADLADGFSSDALVIIGK
jgi:hypothetical protein